ncbi:MAG: hypothetical protein PHS02_03440 [Candidatus ainarchaeum sp.]|nr:hypothetical protein [Candidatus ainarchaeum sp.]
MAEESTLAVLQKRWESVCKVLFKANLGSMEDYSEWLGRDNEKSIREKSSVSEKEVCLFVPYPKNAKYVSFDEVEKIPESKPLSINDIKDIDSLVSSLSESFYYSGNVVLGNSGHVEKSSNIGDSFYMYETGRLNDSRYIGYSTLGRLNQDCFGCNGIGESQFCVKCYETFRDRRCFELWMGQRCSDCFYSHNLSSCQDCFFCFNLKNTRHAIGNLKLTSDKYNSIKAHLISQIAEELKRNKRIPSLIEIVGKAPLEKPAYSGQLPEQTEASDKKSIEEAFSKTAQVLFGKPLSFGMDSCNSWLQNNLHAQETCTSAFSGKPVYRWDYSCYFKLPKNRLLKESEAQAIGPTLKLSAKEIEGIALSNAHERIGKIAFFTPEYYDGANYNLIECATSTESMNCYRSSPIIFSKYCGYTFWPRTTSYVFGCDSILDSVCCINCYNSVKLNRCFELYLCRDCSDVYFSHNCENVHQSMFCFNTKNKKYAIGNKEFAPDEYAKIKSMLLGRIAGELEAKKEVKYSVFNIGSRN